MDRHYIKKNSTIEQDSEKKESQKNSNVHHTHTQTYPKNGQPVYVELDTESNKKEKKIQRNPKEEEFFNSKNFFLLNSN